MSTLDDIAQRLREMLEKQPEVSGTVEVLENDAAKGRAVLGLDWEAEDVFIEVYPA